MSRSILTSKTRRIGRKIITEDAQAIRALRITKNLSRRQAGTLCGVSARAFEQIENGRCFVSAHRIGRYLEALGCTQAEFSAIRIKASEIIANAEKNFGLSFSKNINVRRNCRKLVTKEVRVIRILRRRKGFSQYQAAALCKYANSIFGQIENGRIELPRERIEHIVKHLGHPVGEFDRLMQAEHLRDEMIEKCTSYLENIEDHKLHSVQSIIQTLMKA